jgi:hypothetical protein
MDVKLDMELDMKISHGRAREEREACARGEEDVQAGPEPGQTGSLTGSPGPQPGLTGLLTGLHDLSYIFGPNLPFRPVMPCKPINTPRTPL